MNFPDDENGDVLRRMVASGDDISLPRNVDFIVVFPDQSLAEEFAAFLTPFGHTISVKKTDTAVNFPWDVLIAKFMTPSHQEIEDFESFLGEQAAKFGGHNDGWGSMSQP